MAFQLTFNLQQHTPLIHFQHGQPEVSLRATEVKAKLDRFITSVLPKSYPDLWNKYKEVVEWAFEDSANAKTGDYKISIQSTLKEWFVVANYINPKEVERANREYGVKILPLTAYFADAEGIKNGMKQQDRTIPPFQKSDFSEVRKGLMFENIKMNVFSFHQEVLDMLEVIVPVFFSNYNFGTRQTKGFGCFSVEGMSPDSIKSYLTSNQNIATIYECKASGAGNFKLALQNIQENYQLMKSGKSFGGYQKSLLWRYLCSKNGISWEKRMVKKELESTQPRVWENVKYDERFDGHRIEKCQQDDRDNYHFIRALLGLSEQMEFLTTERRDKITLKIAESNKEIDRYASPIQFKVIGNSIILFAYDVDNALIYKSKTEKGNQTSEKRKYSFTLDAKISGQRITGKVGDSLSVPENFKIADFLQFALKDSGVIQGYHKIK